MSNFKEIIIENNDLAKRIIKLEDFLKSEDTNKLDKDQLSLLGTQLTAMRTYSICLRERIDRWNIK